MNSLQQRAVEEIIKLTEKARAQLHVLSYEEDEAKCEKAIATADSEISEAQTWARRIREST